MECKWCVDIEDKGTCINSDSPYCGNACAVTEHPEICQYSENKYDVSELVEILRRCGSCHFLCDDCPANISDDECESKIAKLQAADMLEQLAAENERLKMLLTELPKEDESDDKNA